MSEWIGDVSYITSSDIAIIRVGSGHAITDCNNIPPERMAYVYNSAAHTPDSNNSWNVWCRGLDKFRAQIAINVTSSAPVLMIRSSHSGAWSDWVEK